MSLQSKHASCLEKALKEGQRMTLSEGKVRLYVIAANDIEIYRVDGCIITSSTKRCDYVVCFEGYTKFIELKGIDVNHAYNQIYETVCYFERDSELRYVVNNVECLIGYIASHRRDIPNIMTTHKKKACRKLHSKSKRKLGSLFDHIKIVVVVNKQPGHHSPKNNQNILVSNDNPLKL